MRHIPVLLRQTIDALALQPGSSVVDATVGDGGHSEEVLKKIGATGRLLALDADEESLARAKNFLVEYNSQCTFVCSNFVDLERVARENGFAKVDGILMDFGWSMPQFKERGRGFSFERDEPLDMRYHPSPETISAADILATYTQSQLESLFRTLAEERFARQIAEAVILARNISPITTSGQLSSIVVGVYRKILHSTKEIPWVGGIHPATKVFQALRIEVNQELLVIKKVLPQALAILKPGGRLAVITFHSLEDRLVKHFFSAANGKEGVVVTKKPLTADDAELNQNLASRSAKLRIFEKK